MGPFRFVLLWVSFLALASAQGPECMNGFRACSASMVEGIQGGTAMPEEKCKLINTFINCISVLSCPEELKQMSIHEAQGGLKSQGIDCGLEIKGESSTGLTDTKDSLPSPPDNPKGGEDCASGMERCTQAFATGFQDGSAMRTGPCKAINGFIACIFSLDCPIPENQKQMLIDQALAPLKSQGIDCEISANTVGSQSTGGSCSRFEEPSFCTELGYNMASFPNRLGHQYVIDASLVLNQYFPLIQVKCSPQIAPFLCGLYLPRCNNTAPPCRSLCLQARRGCRPILEKFGFAWPEPLNCDKFPESGNCYLDNFEIKGESSTGLTGTKDSLPSLPDNPNGGVPEEAAGGEVSGPSPDGASDFVGCRKLKTDMCAGLGYTDVIFPNRLGHKSEEEALAAMGRTEVAASGACNSHPIFQKFLCSLYLPPCTLLEIPVPPCRSLCENAGRSCSASLMARNVRWPREWNCDDITPEPSNRLCVSESESSSSSGLSSNGPNRGPGGRPNIGPGGRPNIGPGGRPNIGPGGRPNIGPGGRPNIGHGGRPNIGPGGRPNIGPDGRPIRGPGGGSRGGPNRGPTGGPNGGPNGGGPNRGPHGLVSQCLAFKSELCSNTLPYSEAGFPNLAGQMSPEQSDRAMSGLTPILRSGCSHLLQDFLCSVHFPQCSERKIVPPCRSLCQESYTSCAQFLATKGMVWPPILSCDKFPVNGNCFKGRVDEKGTSKEVKSSVTSSPKVSPTPGSSVDGKPPTGTIVVKPPTGGMLGPEMMMNPIMEWLKSSTKLNKEKSTLVAEQVKVAKLTEEKLALEIIQLKEETEKGGPSPP